MQAIYLYSFYLKILSGRLIDTKSTRATLAAITDLLKKIVKSGFEFAIILKESIRFRADKESSFIQKIKLLGM